MRKCFSEIIGNESTKNRFASAVLKNTLPHAFLFIGASGSGKKTLARELAAALNCENRENGALPLPCRTCNTCRRIASGLFTDIHSIKRETDKMSIGVGVIEKMREDMMLSATESEYRIYIIEEAEKITPQAQNAMLKILEEPPAGVIIILLAEEADKILTTIKSRVQTVHMERFSSDDMLALLKEKSTSARDMESSNPEGLKSIISAADGRLGKALLLLESKDAAEEISERREFVMGIIAALRQNAPFKELYTAVSAIPKSRAEFREAVEDVLSAVRDLLLLKHDKNVPLLFFTSRDEALGAGEKINIKRLLSVYDIFERALEDNSKNANIGAQTANLAAQIKLI